MQTLRSRKAERRRAGTGLLLLLLAGAGGCVTRGGMSLSYDAEGERLRVRHEDGSRLTFHRVPSPVYAEAARHRDVVTYLHASVLRGHLVEWEEAGEAEPLPPVGRGTQ